MISCGALALTCDFPIHLDTYKGCSHACKYCFVKRKYAIEKVQPLESVRSLKNFIDGKRTRETRWCDWNIPLHWGANSDPFQPCELEYKTSMHCLEVFAETGYPFIVSTKNPVMLTKEPYLSLIKNCNMILQVSMACSKYDRLEQGAPTYQERLEAVGFLSDKVKRVIARCRPYFPDCHKDILKEIPKLANAGVYGVNYASFISANKQAGMKRYGNCYMFSVEILIPKYKELRNACHENGLKFLCSETDLDHWSDENCCGAGNLDGFTPNLFNACHLGLDEEPPVATEAMKRTDTYQPFKGIGQSQKWAMKCKDKSFYELMLEIGERRIQQYREQKDIYKLEE